MAEWIAYMQLESVVPEGAAPQPLRRGPAAWRGALAALKSQLRIEGGKVAG